MRVLHMTSENPLVHQGGMNRYCYDLFRIQNNIGIDSFVLFPGRLGKGDGKYNFKKLRKNFFRFDGALPVSLIFGIDEPDRYMIKYDKDGFETFFAKYRFDVCHVHSIQGFPAELFAAAKECGVRLVFTTHDYYPFCFLYNLYCWDGSVCDSVDVLKCMPCSKFAGLGEKTQRIRQSPLADTAAVQIAKKFYLKLKKRKK